MTKQATDRHAGGNPWATRRGPVERWSPKSREVHQLATFQNICRARQSAGLRTPCRIPGPSTVETKPAPSHTSMRHAIFSSFLYISASDASPPTSRKVSPRRQHQEGRDRRQSIIKFRPAPSRGKCLPIH